MYMFNVYMVHKPVINVFKKIVDRLRYRTVYKHVPLGRWNILYDKKHLSSKIDRANEDHCGPCGQMYKFKHPNILDVTKTTNK